MLEYSPNTQKGWLVVLVLSAHVPVLGGKKQHLSQDSNFGPPAPYSIDLPFELLKPSDRATTLGSLRTSF